LISARGKAPGPLSNRSHFHPAAAQAARRAARSEPQASEVISMDKRTTEAAAVAELRDGMTVGIGGWGSRRKPMSIVREILRSPVKDLTLVSYGGPDVGLLCKAGKVRRLIYGFVSLDSIPLEPHFRAARQAGAIPEVRELDEGMLQWGLYAAAIRLPFLPTRAGLGTSVLEINPELKTVRSPYEDGEELVAMPALPLDVAFVHMNRADARGNAQYLGPDLYFDDLYCMAAKRRFVSCEKLVETKDLLAEGSLHTLRINRTMVDGVIEAPGGAHFTECPPDYGRDEAFQREYAASAKDEESWQRFRAEWLDVPEREYQRRVAARRATK
jgi:glutaconate CoA-transferase subunit A